MIFNNGTYWIYLNEQTGVLDSCFLTKGPLVSYFHRGGYPDDPIDEYCYIGFSGHLLSTTVVTPEDVQIEWSWWGSVCLRPDFSQRIFNYRVSGDIYKIVQFYDSLKINNNMFKNVINTQLIASQFYVKPIIDTATFSYFLAKNIGIVKLRKQYHQSDTIWSLIRWHVVR